MQTALKTASNWKSPGPDAIPNFWLKQLTALHQHLLNGYNQAIEHPENLPDWFTTAQTYLLPKNKDTENPKNYRPIAYLSTSYKVLTSILTERSYTHITRNDILPEEQRGCVKNSYGCKELDHSLKLNEVQYPKQVLEHEQSKAKKSITTNATKFKREVTMTEQRR